MTSSIRQSRVHCPVGSWATVLDFLIARFPEQGAEVWAQRLGDGLVQTESGQALSLTSAHVAHRMLFYRRDVPDEVDLGWREQLVFQDEHIVVADKPHGMPVTPGGSVLRGCLLVRLQDRLQGRVDVSQLQPLHRIDAATAGLVVFGLRLKERAKYHSLFADRAVHKRYLAAAMATPEQLADLPALRHTRIESDPAHFMRMREVGGAPNSLSHIRLLAHHQGVGQFELSPVTGKRHQLRLHMAALGLPLLHDRIYPEMLSPLAAGELAPPMQLVAAEIGFVDPFSGEARAFKSSFALTPSQWRDEQNT